MTTDAIADVIDANTRAAGLDDHVTSHVLRYTFVTELTRGGVDLVTVAELMGHASLETTRLYTRPSDADMQRRWTCCRPTSEGWPGPTEQADGIPASWSCQGTAGRRDRCGS
jgi:site-specific recombinase XerD